MGSRIGMRAADDLTVGGEGKCMAIAAPSFYEISKNRQAFPPTTTSEPKQATVQNRFRYCLWRKDPLLANAYMLALSIRRLSVNARSYS